MENALNPSTQKLAEADIKFKDNLVYIVSSRPAHLSKRKTRTLKLRSPVEQVPSCLTHNTFRIIFTALPAVVCVPWYIEVVHLVAVLP